MDRVWGGVPGRPKQRGAGRRKGHEEYGHNVQGYTWQRDSG